MFLLSLFFVPAAHAQTADPWGPPRPALRPVHDAAIDTAWMGAAAGLDLASTRYALARCLTCYEGHPLMRPISGALALKLGTTAAAGWGCYELRRRGHARAAKWLRWGVVIVWSGAAVNNLARAR